MKKLGQLLLIIAGIKLPVVLLLMSVQTLPAKSDLGLIEQDKKENELEKELKTILNKTNQITQFKMSKYDF